MQKPAHDHPKVVAKPPLIYAGFLALAVLFDRYLPMAVFHNELKLFLGLSIVLLGFLIAFSAVGQFKRAGTSFKVYEAASAIVQDGLYRISRNPIYIALTLIYTGLAVVLGNLWSFLFLPFVMMVMHYGVIVREEDYLQRKFGEEYLRYKQSVRRWL